jgi:hypothetical protein
VPKHRSLNLKRFITGIPENLLEEYFRQKFGDEAPSPLNKFDYDSIRDFVESPRSKDIGDAILEDFACINDICERGMNLLVQAIDRYHISTTDEEIAQELAMKVFLDNNKEVFEYAYDLYCLYNSPGKMSHRNISADKLKVTDQKMEKFRSAISQFYAKQAKGRDCIIRHYVEKGKVMIVVMRGSYKRSVAAWEKQKIKTLLFRPASEDILQFDKTASVLSIRAPYNKDKDNYIKTFTNVILEDNDQVDRPDRDRTYTLVPLQTGDFSFEGNDVIESITLLEVKINLRGLTMPTLTISSSDIRETCSRDLPGFRLSIGDLVHAKFRFGLLIDGKHKKVTFEITPPNVTDLNKKKYADIIEVYLKDNGVKLV